MAVYKLAEIGSEEGLQARRCVKGSSILARNETGTYLCNASIQS